MFQMMVALASLLLDEDLLNPFLIVQKLGVAILQLQEQMRP
jgi:hypothetical protein